LKVLVISGCVPDDFVDQFGVSNPYPIVSKPFSHQLLTDAIENILGADTAVGSPVRAGL
jgi:hypothetical protein